MMKDNKKILETILFLSRINKKFKNGRLKIISSDRVHNSKFSFFRYIVSNKEFRKLPYSNIIINYFKKSESLYPGCSYYLSEFIVNKFISKSDFFRESERIKNTLENIEKYFLQISSLKNFNLIKNVLRFSGPDATLLCQSSSNNNISVCKRKNPVFNVSIHKDFAPIYFSKSKSKTQTYLISVADAYIERESEIFSLIEEAKKNNVALMIFCRGISDNAVRALKSIIARNNIHILPYIVKFDNEDPFKLEDLADVIGCSILRIESGDNIYKNLIEKSVSNILKASWDKIEIIKPSLSKLNDSINKKLSVCNDENLRKYLFKRKSRINTNVVEVTIPDSEIELLNELKCLIVAYNNIAVYGLCRVRDTLYSKKCVDVSRLLGEKLFDTLNSIGYVVLSEKR